MLIGDAAGHNDPILGQGLSIALRDVRLVSEILRDARTAGRAPDFRPYVEERAERMRRLRIAARLASMLRVEFGPQQRKRRARVGKRVAEDLVARTGRCEPDESGAAIRPKPSARNNREIARILTLGPCSDRA